MSPAGAAGGYRFPFVRAAAGALAGRGMFFAALDF